MKGHLGFRCQPCFLPGPPTDLHQVGFENFFYWLSGTMAWSPPDTLGGGPILGYRIEMPDFTSADVGAGPIVWREAGSTAPDKRTYAAVWCREGGYFRVSARNRCGWGEPAYFSGWIFSVQNSVQVLTGSGTLQPPCWASTAKLFCVGRGGTYSEGGGGGGVAWKTWTNTTRNQWDAIEYTVLNASNQTGPARSSATHKGQTVIAYGGSGPDAGGFTGGDGGAGGNPGGNGYNRYPGQDGGSITYPFGGAVQYTGNYYFGGGIGGPTGTNPDGTLTRPLPVSPCRRHPAKDVGGLLSAVALAGLKAEEDCYDEPAFGSGGVAIPYSTYGSSAIYFAPGYGGGGFDSSCPGGPGCILVKYS